MSVTWGRIASGNYELTKCHSCETHLPRPCPASIRVKEETIWTGRR